MLTRRDVYNTRVCIPSLNAAKLSPYHGSSRRGHTVHQPSETEVQSEEAGSRVYEQSQITSSITFSHYIITADVGAAPVARRPAVQMPDEYLPPNKILFLQNLPESVTKDQLNALFSQYPNLHEVRLVPSKKDIAFVEYLDEGSATVAKDALHNYKLDGENKIKVRIFAQTLPSLTTFYPPRSPSPESKFQGCLPRHRPRFHFALSV